MNLSRKRDKLCLLGEPLWNYQKQSMYNSKVDVAYLSQRAQGTYPEWLGMQVMEVGEGKVVMEMPIQQNLFAPNGFVHGGSIISLADTVAGFATLAHLPPKATSFTTIELKTNFLGAAKEGTLVGESRGEHLGRTTQVWRVDITHKETGKKIAVFSCTQLVIYPKK